MSGREKKWTVYNINNESFDKCECSVLFCSNILLLSMSNSNREKFKKHNFGKKVLHETKKVNSLRFVIVVIHFTTVVENVVNTLWDFNERNITFNYKRVQKKFDNDFESEW